MHIKSISKSEHQIYTVTYKKMRLLPVTKSRKVFSAHDTSRSWFWLDTGQSVGTKLSRILSGVRSRDLDFLEN